MMKFKEGDIVEVWRTVESCGSWFPAKIDFVAGHKLVIRLDLFLTENGEPVVEEVRREDVRPHPPYKCMEVRWAVGDIAEVFDRHSWREGKVVKVLNKRNNWFVIKLFGSIQLKEFHGSCLRVPQAWQGKRWTIIKKDSESKNIDIEHTHSSSIYSQNFVNQARGGATANVCTRERHLQQQFSGKKRKSTTARKGFELAKRELPKQVDVVSFPKTTMGEKHMLASIKRKVIGSSRIEVEMVNRDMQALQSFAMPLQVIGENDECSVASCSGNIFQEYTVEDSRQSFRDIAGSSLDDAESFCRIKPGNRTLNFGEELAANVHKLELHAYRSTVQAFYASGPLSWEQESLLTNLRLSLNVSNEEHLLQLRDLLSAPVL